MTQVIRCVIRCHKTTFPSTFICVNFSKFTSPAASDTDRLLTCIPTQKRTHSRVG